MKVEQLIEQLKTFHQDATVKVWDCYTDKEVSAIEFTIEGDKSVLISSAGT